MNRFKLFEEYFQDLNEGAIPVFPPDSPYKQEGSIQWTGVEKLFTQGIPQRKQGPWLETTKMTVVSDLNDKDYDRYIADKAYQSVPLGTFGDEKLPLFSSKNPKYDESEFEVIEIVPNKEKPREPYVKVVDKNGLEFMIPPYKIIEIQKGSSIIDRIFAGSKYRFGDGRKGMVVNYTPEKEIHVKMDDGEVKKIKLAEWKADRGRRPLNETNEQ
jgi:hypothetical protein